MEKHPDTRVLKMPKSLGSELFGVCAKTYLHTIIDLMSLNPYMDYNEFVRMVCSHPRIKGLTLPPPYKFKAWEDFMWPLLTRDPDAAIVVDKKGEPIPDPELRDTENVPFTYPDGIEGFMDKEVRTYAPDAYVNYDATKIGYEISFTKYFYKPAELRELNDILDSLTQLEKEADGVLSSIMEGIG